MKRVFVLAGLASSLALSGGRALGQTPIAPASPTAASPDVAPAVAEPPRSPVAESRDDVPTDAPPRSRSAKTTGLELGLRTGYGLPIGAADGGTRMDDMITGIVPLWVDVGYRFSPSTYGGLYFQHGFGSLNTDSGKPESACTSPGVSCSTSDVRFGFDLDVHLAPANTFDPWLGFGTGFEIQTYTATGPAATATLHTFGLEYLNLQIGGNWNVTPALAVGPFVSFSLDEFKTIDLSTTSGQAPPGTNGDIADTRVHEWFVLGIRSTYDLKI